MLATCAKRLTPALLAVAALSLSAVTCSSAAIAQSATTVQPAEPAAVLAAREYLRAIGYKTFVEAKIAAVARTKIAFKILLEREPILEDQEAKIIAAHFTAEELRETSKFQSSATGALYRTFNREMSANPFTTPEIYRSEIAKRFTSEQRAVVFSYVSSSVGKKWQLVQADLTKAEKEIGEQWDRQTQEAIEQAVRTGQEAS
jgi:hypothetical protein